ncbi:MAG UNVERIFIED_CONTAM: hypothetical protein LVT10_22535 [Anaerolineae bacterium]
MHIGGVFTTDRRNAKGSATQANRWRGGIRMLPVLMVFRPSRTDDLGLTWLYADEAQATWKPTLGSFTARGRPTDYKNRLMNG